MEDPEQDGRVRGVPGDKLPGVQAHALGHSGQHGLAQAGQRIKVGQHQRAQPGDLPREPRQARPPRSMAISSLSAAGSAKNSALASASSASRPGRHAVARQVEKPALAAGHLDLLRHRSPRRRRPAGRRR
ncbi:MAG: hypothetical protein ABSA53_23505 [Streptosporangiaceae bacterium]